jgi:hypothetical protein
MDDFRIYNRVLTPQEIGLLAAGQGSDAPSTPASAAQKITGTSVVIPPGGSTTATGFTITANVSDPSNRTVRLEAEVRPRGTIFSDTPNVTAGPLVASGTQAGIDVTGLVRGFYHWQLRAKNVDGLTSPWVVFGDGASAYDLFAGPNAAPTFSAPTQEDPLTGRTLPIGSNLSSAALRIRAGVADADSDPVTLEAEVLPEGVAFAGVATHSSHPGLGVLAIDLAVDEGGGHWQVRAVDGFGAASPWVAHSGAGADFHLPTLGSLGNSKVCSASGSGVPGGLAIFAVMVAAGLRTSSPRRWTTRSRPW